MAADHVRKMHFPKYILKKKYLKQKNHLKVNKYRNFHEDLTIISFFIEFKKKNVSVTFMWPSKISIDLMVRKT